MNPDSPMASWEHFPHDADIGIRGFGATKQAAFEQAGLALTAVTADPASIEARRTSWIACEAPDDELLLVDWLNALIFHMAHEKMLYNRFQITLADRHLTGRAWGEPVHRDRHAPRVEVKGATYTELAVYQDPTGLWVAQCIVDV